MIETKEYTISNIASYQFIRPDKLRRQYKKHFSNFKEWDQLPHAETYMLFPDNIGEYLSIDEVNLSQGELYTFITNKKGKVRKKSIVASIKGTASQDIFNVINKIPLEQRLKVKEVTLDMARNMEAAVKLSFPNAKLVTDRFHVVKLLLESLSQVRMLYRREAIEQENTDIEQAKKEKRVYHALELSNGDTLKQLLARSRHAIFKESSKWTENQRQRTDILFELYPDIKHAYNITMKFRKIYDVTSKLEAKGLMESWIDDVFENEEKYFFTAANSIKYHLENILNFFNNRNTNANAESFNAKIKLFRANLRGVRNIDFFLFRLAKLFA